MKRARAIRIAISAVGILVVLGWIALQSRPTAQDLARTCIYGSYADVEILLERGAPVNGRDSEACTPLTDAAMNRKTAIAELLVAHGADVNATIPGGEPPLFYAKSSGDSVLAEFLEEHGARPLP